MRSRPLAPPRLWKSLPTDDDLRDLRATAANLDARTSALDADAMALLLVAETALTARLVADGEESPASPLPSGSSLEAKAIGRIVLEIEGVGRVELSRSSPDPERRRQALDDDRRAFASRLDALGAETLDELDDRRRRADRRASLEAELAAMLGDDSIDALNARLADRTEALRSLEVSVGHRGPDNDATANESADVDSAIERLRIACDRAERDLAIARDRLDAAGGDPGPVDDLAPDEADRHVAEANRSLVEAERILADRDSAIEAARKGQIETEARLRDAERTLADESAGDANARSRLELQISSHRHSLIPLDADPQGETSQAVAIVRRRLDERFAERNRLRDDASRAFAVIENERTAAASRSEAARRRLDELQDDAEDDRSAEDRSRHLDELRRLRGRADAQVEVLRDQLGPDPAADADEFEAHRAEVVGRCWRWPRRSWRP